MILNNMGFASLAEKIKKEKRKVIIYGAGMIGEMILPYFIGKYSLHQYIKCYVDIDNRKVGKIIHIGKYIYEIKPLNYLYQNYQDGVVVLITNSKFTPVIRFLEQIKELDAVERCIIPLVQLYELEKLETIQIQKQTPVQLIPKKIHYCWFGKKPIPEFLRMCMSSWKELCPDYEITEWNEENYDINRCAFTRQAYDRKKFAFVSDLARLEILYENGGIYMDTDVTITKNLDSLLYQKGFVGVEKWGNINTGGGCGFIAGHPILKKLIDYRKEFSFILEDGTPNTKTNGWYESKVFLELGFRPDNTLQKIEDVTVYPSYVNHPYDYVSCETHRRDSTVSIHHFYGGWMDAEDRENRKNTQSYYNLMKVKG